MLGAVPALMQCQKTQISGNSNNMRQPSLQALPCAVLSSVELVTEKLRFFSPPSYTFACLLINCTNWPSSVCIASFVVKHKLGNLHIIDYIWTIMCNNPWLIYLFSDQFCIYFIYMSAPYFVRRPTEFSSCVICMYTT